MKHYILKHVDKVIPGENQVSFELTGVEACTLPHTPGWLTAESPEEQGIETGMPNLPQDLQLPGRSQVRLKALVRVLGPETIRITIAPSDHQLWKENDLFPGIMVAATNGDQQAQISQDHTQLSIRLPEAELTIAKHPFALSLRKRGRTLLQTGNRLRQVAGFPMAPPVLCTQDSISMNLEMATGEKIFGFGEQFSRFEKTGQKLVLETNDALGTGTGRAYKPVPVWHSSAGYSAFINTGAVTSIDVGHERPSVLGISLDDRGIDLVLFTANTPKQRLCDYTALTGRANRPQLWAFGYWMGRCRYHCDTEMLEVAQQMRSKQIPADVLHLDPDWLIVDRLNTDFIWNQDRFGARKQFLADLRNQHFRLSLWQLPYLDPASPVFTEAKAKGLLLKMPDGRLAEIQGTPTPDGRFRALWDLTNPETIKWFAEKEAEFFADGLAAIKTDFGEGCPPGALAADGTPPNYIHNLFPLRYNGAIFDLTKRLTGKPTLVWGRSGWAGSQRYPGQWGGDAESTVVGMQATLRGGLSYAVSAPGLWSHDIGGFYGPELTPGLYIRWTQMGAFSPLMRAHGLRPREPWEFGDQALEICRDWIRRRYSLLPYIWQVAKEVAQQGVPFIRPLCLEYPEDPVAIEIDDQYFFGPSMLVAPIFDDTMESSLRQIYLPGGTWWDFQTGERFTGPGFIQREVPISQMPIFVKDGAVIPRVQVDETIRCSDDLVELPWQVHIWGRNEGQFELDGFAGPAQIEKVIRH